MASGGYIYRDAKLIWGFDNSEAVKTDITQE